MTQQCAVAGLPRETNDGCFDAANTNKSCVRVHVGQSSEFPIYPIPGVTHFSRLSREGSPSFDSDGIYIWVSPNNLVCDNAAIKRCPAQYRKKKKKNKPFGDVEHMSCFHHVLELPNFPPGRRNNFGINI